MGVFLCWFFFQIALERLLPADIVDGVRLSNGKRLKYRVNGHLAFWISIIVMGHGFPQFEFVDDNWRLVGLGSFPVDWIYDNYLALATASILFSYALSVYLYLASFFPSSSKLLAEGGCSGNVIYDFFIGRELNPRIGSFDLKYFCELRPGLIGWVVINYGMLIKQYNELGYVELSMLAVNAFQALYVWDALYNERSILTTMDITTDGFGFMLAFGDLAWVPFTYTLQTRVLVDYPSQLSSTFVLILCALCTFGYMVFRGANSQKDRFRRDPETMIANKEIKYIDTKRGTRLIISGWWGMARKINYTGDWLMGLSWCAFTGFNSIVTYFYAIYFAILLIHRAIRDDHFCRQKYGADWDRYKKHV
eukprot:CAMPEP_0201546794 /NCGR_PEP_ID=MMETSP0173_2-20130828/3159_1 /ASSEMBLY_ACC=CAM_ASM_000268 /TAXON_ID=218659 /ORGANISM="Vexillifera sp., Strain DIVA3 564/2" /LENGTH=363 /DNA_ID=CAMNT_0047955581 /DNA_START=190 /DNA_END=1278 /DNA_ORIENTATION=-